MAEIDPLKSGKFIIKWGASASAEELPPNENTYSTRYEITMVRGVTTAEVLRSMLSQLRIGDFPKKLLDEPAGDNNVFDNDHELSDIDETLEAAINVNSSKRTPEYISILRELAQVGIKTSLIADGLTPELAANHDYIIALKELNSAGIVIDNYLIKYLTVKKALNCDYINGLKRLASSGARVSFNTISKISIEAGANTKYIDTLIMLHKHGFDLSGFPYIDTKGINLGEFTLEKGTNDKYFDILIKCNGDFEKADEVYVAARGLSKDLNYATSLLSPASAAFTKKSEYIGHVRKLLAMYLANPDDEVLQQIIMGDGIEHVGTLSHLLLRLAWMMNELHSLPDSRRYEVIETFSSKELYLLLAYGRNEIYTSTFNIIFNRLLQKMKEENIDGITLIREADPKNVHYRQTLTTFSSYGRLREFLATIKDPEERKGLIRKFTSELGLSREMQKDSVSIAELLYNESDPEILGLVRKYLIESYNTEQDAEIKKAYGIIGSIYYSKSRAKEFKLFSERYPVNATQHIDRSELINKNNEIIEQQYFYDDDDGKMNFEMLVAMYKNTPNCTIEDKGTYVIITKVTPNGIKLKIYANRPSMERGINDIHEEFKKKQLSSIIVVHRGHSYHAEKTIENIPSIARIVYLGSCGGFNDVSRVLERAPLASVISTQGMGSVTVNLPLIRNINNSALSTDGVTWKTVWSDTQRTFQDDPYRRGLFEYYIRPDQNIAALFIYAYNHGK